MSYIEVLNKILDSENATVGGGSASALSGAMAAGLIGMVARLSIKKDHGLAGEKHLEIANELDKINKELLQGSEEDTKAYLLIKDAFALPRGTDEEKEIRKKAVEAAGISAATVPVENAYRCKKVYELAKVMDGKYNTNAASDFVIGMELARLGIQGCVLNIEANLSLIKDEKEKQDFESHIKALKK